VQSEKGKEDVTVGKRQGEEIGRMLGGRKPWRRRRRRAQIMGQEGLGHGDEVRQA